MHIGLCQSQARSIEPRKPVGAAPRSRSRVHAQLLVREAVSQDPYCIWRAHGRILLVERIGNVHLYPQVSAMSRSHAQTGSSR